jgi:hypothetical protein
MKLILRTILIFIVLTFSAETIKAEIKFLGKDTLDLRGSFKFMEGSSMFDVNGDETVEIPMAGQEGEDTPLTYLFNLSKYTLDLAADFYLTDNLIISAGIPFSAIRYYEEYDSLQKALQWNDNTSKYDTVSYRQRTPGVEYSLFQSDYYTLGAKYVFYKKKGYAALSADMRIPHNFENYSLDTNNKDFVYGSSYNYLVGLIIGARFNLSYIETSFKYNNRAGDFTDQFIIKAEGAFSKVEETHLRFKALFVMNTGSMKNAIAFDPRKPTLSEEYIELGVDFRIALSANFYTEIGYTKVLYGKNTWNIGEFLVSAGFLLK